MASPVVSRDSTAVYVGSLDGTLRAVSSTTGTTLWEYAAGEVAVRHLLQDSEDAMQLDGSLVLSIDGTVLFAITSTNLLTLKSSSGQLVGVITNATLGNTLPQLIVSTVV